MDEMLKKQDVLDAIYATMEKTDKPDVVLGLAAAMSTVKQMQAMPVNPAEKPEPCTDAISRQAVLDLAKFDGRENLGSIIHAFDVEQLPPVKPAEKVGQWIDDNKDEIDAQYGRHLYRCQICNKYAKYFVGGTEDWWDIAKPNYCPHCGAKMGG